MKEKQFGRECAASRQRGISDQLLPKAIHGRESIGVDKAIEEGRFGSRSRRTKGQIGEPAGGKGKKAESDRQRLRRGRRLANFSRISTNAETEVGFVFPRLKTRKAFVALVDGGAVSVDPITPATMSSM